MDQPVDVEGVVLAPPRNVTPINDDGGGLSTVMDHGAGHDDVGQLTRPMETISRSKSYNPRPTQLGEAGDQSEMHCASSLVTRLLETAIAPSGWP
jgi:hypothetical protein